MPDEKVRLSASANRKVSSLRVRANDHEVIPKRLDGRWRVRVPSSPGFISAYGGQHTSADSVRLQVFVLTPWSRKQRSLNGYRIGSYQRGIWKRRKRHALPKGFIRVTEALLNERVSPHFQLKQFLCKQTDDTP